MRRREFITLVAAAHMWPVLAMAQQRSKMPTVGILGSGTPASHGPWIDGFVLRLRELGWTEGRNIAFERRWASGQTERYGEIAAEFVRLGVDVILTSATPPVIAAKQATSSIPIVFAAAADPVGTGLVASLARPGGNVTGISMQQTDTAAKRLELLRECVPRLRRLGVLINLDNPTTRLEMNEVEAAARVLGLDVVPSGIRQSEDIAPALAMLRDRVEALYIVPDPVTIAHAAHIITLAQGGGLPTMWYYLEHIEAGGLISYGANVPDLFRRAADLVDKILHGTKPSEIPVEQPTKFDLAINLITAKALGLKVPATLIARADKVIE